MATATLHACTWTTDRSRAPSRFTTKPTTRSQLTPLPQVGRARMCAMMPFSHEPHHARNHAVAVMLYLVHLSLKCVAIVAEGGCKCLKSKAGAPERIRTSDPQIRSLAQ